MFNSVPNILEEFTKLQKKLSWVWIWAQTFNIELQNKTSSKILYW